jgi:ketosteroid isomerase-like protein
VRSVTASSISPTDLWFRLTLGLRSIGGRWKLLHEHESVPFYMDGSYKAAVDLRP